MPTPILMPALSPTMEAGTLAKWLVKEGDTVSSGDVIAEIETDKATMEVEAVDEGTVGKIVVAEGTADVPVNDTIAILLAEGESADDIAAAPSEAKAPAAQKPEAKDQAAAETSTGGAADATRNGTGSGNGSGASTAGAAPKGGDGGRVFASPLARRLAKEGGIDLAAVSGTGPHGRIVKADVEQAKTTGTAPAKAPEAAKAPASAPAAKAPPPTGAPAGMSDDQIKAMFAEGAYKEIPHDGMRKTIARRLTESKQTIPHFYLTRDVELDALLKLRGDLNAAAPKDGDGKPAYKLSVNDFVIKAMALALRDVPMANATYTSASRLIHTGVDVGVAVAIPDGLITPVVRKADSKTLSVISNEMKDLAKRARDKKLQPAEYQGGSTAVSNLGMFGIKDFAAVINPPHGSILAVGAGEQRAVVKDGALAIATVMTVTLSVDHRAVDGALGAEVLQAFARYVESPMALLV
ncbi:pyruvate dehydrogenase complex dihydrolipoamide acetyltransferase [Acuticoccus sp. I52.16.1]|uniref:pyruvate dehydrogenase complex dihydrolipoamide acetyltransferase n=1 Tax=Acuticoccus sp. I52.16.1 TaxID=2928472 RepID=UPI001FD35AF0|nr:pyruvate dehydrogenase complex dihydrolipoamide acetyltransferase [Acuticoccus sp. I52.16.1]UOM33662.1 pyruvate dehydrogenase complex dihydrolipoamide acetyltransferase [Acuticoccus sp. I52.16.1]